MGDGRMWRELVGVRMKYEVESNSGRREERRYNVRDEKHAGSTERRDKLRQEAASRVTRSDSSPASELRKGGAVKLTETLRSRVFAKAVSTLSEGAGKAVRVSTAEQVLSSGILATAARARFSRDKRARCIERASEQPQCKMATVTRNRWCRVSGRMSARASVADKQE